MSESKETVTIKKTTLQWVVIAVIVLVVGFGAGRLTAPATGAAAQNNAQVPPTNPPTQQPAAPTEPGRVTVSLDDDPGVGDLNAPITIVEFSDFQCPFCSRFYEQTLPQLESDYIATGKARLVYRDFPLTSIHPNAQKSAEAAECADDQGKWKEMHDWLFANQGAWSGLGGAAVLAQFKTAAGTMGVNAEQFATCLDTGKYADEVGKDFQDGANAGVSGTPSFFINGRQLVGAQPFSAFKAIIDQELAA